MKVFVDTGPLRALVVPKDQERKRTLEIIESLGKQKAQMFTSDYILDEVFTGLLNDIRGGHLRIKEFNRLILRQKLLQIEWIDRQRWLKTKRLFLKVSKDKTWSFTDCTSYVVMRELKIKKAFSFDEHFKQMGFDLL
ncbi:MAG: hypothetical protein A2784_01525 [Candidatus Chisholmbacteria bacterium RIFCSPHIGHO2_01_FULL_48_12]|uniref:PIN domain-containing protein n=1 Tax=Candidatus Chisholmbacteria bacterium RIFCSPHIGHO2_01_FULL_48_12 TaxID=1797589 RepID=A0A1G1VKC7_9BACT|nr:MAG: hypothetical protein A2784_01525 [Candidatus Chisholmbacteria bacterium RIFCSPHIGHO2_01_FULL_48_12]